jgi:hypothetical protein
MQITKSVQNKVLRRFRSKVSQGTRILVSVDFCDLGSRAAVDQALSRLARAGKIRRLKRGVYDYPKRHPHLGRLSPNLDEVARAIARKNGHRIQVAGARAANALGLSTQVPARTVYLTDGQSRTVMIGNRTLQFRHSSKLAAPGTAAGNVAQALHHVGRSGITDTMAREIRSRISDSDIAQLGKCATIPGWMRSTLAQIESVTSPRPSHEVA